MKKLKAPGFGMSKTFPDACVREHTKMKKYTDSKIVELNNEKYIVYLKRVPVRETKQGKKEIIRAFVKKLRRQKKKKYGIIRYYLKQFSY